MGKRNTPDFYKDTALMMAKDFQIDMTPEAWKEIIQGYSIGPLREVIKGTIDQPKKEQVNKILEDAGKQTSTIISPFIDRFVMSSSDDELRERMYYRIRDELSDINKKSKLGSELSEREKKMLELYGEVKKAEGSARSILAQAAKQKSETRKVQANVEFAKANIELRSKVFAKMKSLEGME